MKPIKNPEEPLALWSGQDRIDNEIHTSVTAIIRSGGCSWNRCRICQYRHERFTGVEKPELSRLMLAQIQRLKEQIEQVQPQVVKVYTSGSFFDPAEVPPDIQEYLIHQVRGKTLIVESRCEYVDLERLSRYVDIIREGGEAGTIVVAIGLETSSVPIREKCIDKGLHFSDYLKTSEAIHKAGGKVKTYLLHKPPYLTEREAHDDMIRSIREIVPITDLISMNPCTVQRNTHLETLWKRQAYRPPYLWSVASILAQSDAHVTCDPIGGGQTRGPHNCGTCDRMILDAIRDYNLNADQELMKSVMEMDCDCKEEWEYVMNQEYPWSMPLTR